MASCRVTVVRSSRPRNRIRKVSRVMPLGSRGLNARASATWRMPPKPATSAIQAPASEAMCIPSRVLRSTSRRSMSAASARYSWASSSCPTSAATTACVHADSDESRTVSGS